jgi:hypothetical protein
VKVAKEKLVNYLGVAVQKNIMMKKDTKNKEKQRCMYLKAYSDSRQLSLWFSAESILLYAFWNHPCRKNV